MGDLYFDDIESESYTDEMILADLEALVKTGQREGTVLDYKSDVSELDNWPQTVAAFANSFGGLIVFGVEAKADQPLRVAGFDPKGVEIRTKLTSMVIDRIQPRPDISVRVLTFGKSTGREIALLRVAEGTNPPYMHSKGQEHRVYIRLGAQKAEADYLQLLTLFEKRRRATPVFGEPAGSALAADPNFSVPNLDQTAQKSAEMLRFVSLLPDDVSPPRLNRESEQRFAQCIRDIRGISGTIPTLRSRDVTVFRVSEGPYLEQRFGVSANGAAGFISRPTIRLNSGARFVPENFCTQLLDFLSVTSLFYERSLRYYGPFKLYVVLSIPGEEGADLFDAPLNGARTGGAYLFEPPMNRIAKYANSETQVSIQPILPSRFTEILEFVLTDVARHNGCVLSADFADAIEKDVKASVAKMVAARRR